MERLPIRLVFQLMGLHGFKKRRIGFWLISENQPVCEGLHDYHKVIAAPLIVIKTSVKKRVK